jgi:hypothetical protein
MMVKAFLRYCVQKLGNMIKIMIRAYKKSAADTAEINMMYGRNKMMMMLTLVSDGHYDKNDDADGIYPRKSKHH